MSDAATEPVVAVHPEPPRAAPDRPIPPHIGRVLSLLQTLIAYGKSLADTLQQHAAAPRLLARPSIAIAFGTTEFAQILIRITRGLLRAAALEARLRRCAARGRDLWSTPRRPPAPRKRRAARPAQAPALDRLPTPEEIAAEVRHRPVGAVLIDICLDFGIAPGRMDRATWDELSLVLIGYGGSLANLVFRSESRRGSTNPTADPTGSPAGSPADHAIPFVAAALVEAARAEASIPSPAWPPRFTHPAHLLGIRDPTPPCTGPP